MERIKMHLAARKVLVIAPDIVLAHEFALRDRELPWPVGIGQNKRAKAAMKKSLYQAKNDQSWNDQ
ncbi:hypothetical protein [Lysobacter sp. P5_B9]